VLKSINQTVQYLYQAVPSVAVVTTIGNNDCIADYQDLNVPNGPWFSRLLAIFQPWISGTLTNETTQ